MARVRLDANGNVVEYIHTMIGQELPPAKTGEYDFDAETNPILVAAINSQPNRVKIVGDTVTLDGNPLVMNQERLDVTLDRNVRALRTKILNGTALSAQEIQIAIRFLVKKALG